MNKRSKKGARVLIWFLIILTLAGLILLFINIIMPLIIQKGTEIEVPNLIGMNREEALQTLNRIGLQPGEIRPVPNDSIPPDRVAAQYPRAGRRVKVGRQIDLDISTGSELVRIPNLEGLPAATAITTLQRLGFVVSRVDSIRSAAVPAGRVVATSPPFGSQVRQGTEITLSVSTKTGTFPMPNLTGLNIETARGILAAHGLKLARLKYAVSSEPEGTILFQYPEEGMPVISGDTVSLLIAQSPKENSR